MDDGKTNFARKRNASRKDEQSLSTPKKRSKNIVGLTVAHAHGFRARVQLSWASHAEQREQAKDLASRPFAPPPFRPPELTQTGQRLLANCSPTRRGFLGFSDGKIREVLP
jgi:hypothetical protein